MSLIPLHLLLPNGKTISLDVDSGDTLHSILQELILLELIPEKDEEEIPFFYCFVDQGTGEKLVAEMMIGSLSIRESGPVYLMVQVDDELEASKQEGQTATESKDRSPETLVNFNILFPSGEAMSIEAPLYTTGNEIIEAWIDSEYFSVEYPNRILAYQLILERTGKDLSDLSLFEMEIQDEDVLLLEEIEAKESTKVQVFILRSQPDEQLLLSYYYPPRFSLERIMYDLREGSPNSQVPPPFYTLLEEGKEIELNYVFAHPQSGEIYRMDQKVEELQTTKNDPVYLVIRLDKEISPTTIVSANIEYHPKNGEWKYLKVDFSLYMTVGELLETISQHDLVEGKAQDYILLSWSKLGYFSFDGPVLEREQGLFEIIKQNYRIRIQANVPLNCIKINGHQLNVIPTWTSKQVKEKLIENKLFRGKPEDFVLIKEDFIEIAPHSTLLEAGLRNNDTIQVRRLAFEEQPICLKLTLPSGERMEREVSVHSTGEQIIDELKREGLIVEMDFMGNSISYDCLLLKREGQSTQDESINIRMESLWDVYAQTGDTLLIENPPYSNLYTINLLIKDLEGKLEKEMDLLLGGTTRGGELLSKLLHQNILPKANLQGVKYGYKLFLNGTDIISKEYELKEECLLEIRPVLDLKHTEDKIVSIFIRLLPGGDEIDLELSLRYTIRDIKEFLIENRLIPVVDAGGSSVNNNFIIASSGVEAPLGASLYSLGIEDGDTILTMPLIISGGVSYMTPFEISRIGRILFDFPEKVFSFKPNRCTIRISTKHLKKYLLRKEFSLDTSIKKIEISKVMKVSLEENSLHPILDIKALSESNQFISELGYSEWNFDVIPQEMGFTSVILKASMLVNVPGLGITPKNVFFLDHEFEVVQGAAQKRAPLAFGNAREQYDGFFEIFFWSDELKSQILTLVSEAKTGKALAKLANFVQDQDEKLFHSLIMLQSQWNDKKNRLMRGVISQETWTLTQNQINEAILELVADIEARHKLQANTVRKHVGNLDEMRSMVEKIG